MRKILSNILTASLVALAGCSILARGKDSAGGGASDRLGDAAGEAGEDSPLADVPQLEADDDDPPHVVSALERLDQMQKYIEARDWERYARESRDFNSILLFKDGWKGERKRPKIKKRLAALDAAAFKSFGGRVRKLVGSGKRITKGADPDAVEAAVVAVKACKEAATQTIDRSEAQSKLDKGMKAYDKAVARALKMDRDAFRFYVEASDEHVNVPTELLECEARLVSVGQEIGDEYEPEVAPKTDAEVACGSMRWLADGVQTGGGFASYSRTAGGAEYAQRVPCKKLKKKDRYPRALRGAIKEWEEEYDIRDAVFVTDGQPYVEEDEDDYRLHRYQVLIAYSKSFTFAGNPCGGSDAKLFCEAGGSKGARNYNELEHHLDRAQFHAGRAPDRCKEHLKGAVKNWENFQSIKEELDKSGDWVSGATYRTKKGEKLVEKEFIASFKEKGELADERLFDKYCSKRRSDDGERTARSRERGGEDDDATDED